MMIRLTDAPSSQITFLRRSWVIGLWVLSFSISTAMAFASNAPTQMGSIESPLTSFRMIIGVFAEGSIIRPRILISTSIGFYSSQSAVVVRDAVRKSRLAMDLLGLDSFGSAGLHLSIVATESLPVAPRVGHETSPRGGSLTLSG